MTNRTLRLRAFIKRWALPAAIAWTLAILTALFLPGGYIPESDVIGIDKVAHFTLFGGFAGLWMIALGDSLRRATLYVVVLGLAYGVFTEIGQELVDGGRHGDFFDAVANTLGVLAGAGAFRLWRRINPEPTAPGTRG